MYTKLFILSLICLFFHLEIDAQTRTKVEKYEVKASQGKLLGKTKPIRDLVPMKQTDPNKRAKQKLIKKQIPNFIGRGKPVQVKPGALPKKEDSIRQKSSIRSSNKLPEILVNMQGLGTGSPNDPTGDIGKDYYIQMVNATRWQVFDKNGNAVSNPMNLNTLWAPLGENSFGDPIVLYDQEYERWILTEFAPIGANKMLVAVSETSNPLGSYFVYAFATPQFPDYPKYSIWTNAICITTNEGGNGTHDSYFIDREDLINGEDNPDIQRLSLPGQPGGPSFFVATPVDWSGLVAPPNGTSPIIMSLSDDAWGTSAQDQIDMFHINLDFNNPDNTTVDQTAVITTPFQTGNVCAAPGPNFACIPQPNGNGIDGIPEIIMNQVHYRNFGSYESIVLNFLVNPEDTEPLAGIRWMELRKSGNSNWSVYQEGTFSPDDGEHRFMGGIAQDGRGNIMMGYVVSSENTFPSIRAVGRYASDPLGIMTTGEIEIINGGSSGPAGRYGDYPQMSVDPFDDRTFWYTSEYLGPNGSALTRIFSAQFEQDSIDFATTALIAPISGSELTTETEVTIQVSNVGFTTRNNFEVGYIFEDGTPVKEIVDQTLNPGENYTHTFSETVNFVDIGDYRFQTFVSLENDTFQLNDTLHSIVSKIPQFDASISNILISDDICADERDIDIQITNLGGITINTVNLEISINGNIINETYNGEIPFSEVRSFNFITDQFIDGTNTVVVSVSMPNGETDQNMSNDAFNTTFEALIGSVNIDLQILTDEFPGETTWEITDENGAVIFNGGPYVDQFTLYTESLCLDAEACYSMTIFDSYGDGICCGFGEGSYQILDANGAPLLIGNADFGSIDTNDFCGTFSCMLNAMISTSPESEANAQDGVISIEAVNAPSSLLYSIDGGMTFQELNFFGGLSSGSYDIVVQADFDCIYEETVELSTCSLDVIINVTDESVIDLGDGSIVFDVMGANDPLSYSIDGGQNFQSDPNFLNLNNGFYEILIRDGIGCTYADTVEVSYLTNTQDVLGSSKGYHAIVMPNPTQGVFKVLLNHPASNEVFTELEIIDLHGKVIRNAQLAKWNGIYEGSFSLVSEADGLYFVRFKDPSIKRMLKVFKQSN